MADMKTVRDLMAAIRETERTTKAYDTVAEVTRVSGSTAWVHIPGGVDETPVMRSIDAERGDMVNVRVSGGKAWITGNNTSPPTGNKVAQQAIKIAAAAATKAENAEEASMSSIVEDVMHYLATSMSSGVTVDTPGWTEEVQTIDETNRYLWTYHSYVLANGNTLDTDPVITGVYGEQGEQGEQGPAGADGQQGPAGNDGVSVTAIQPQYRLSTSSTSIVGGSWSTTLTYTSGYYIWTREQISYSIGTTGYSTAIYDQALTEACSLSYNTAQYFWVNDTGTTSVPTGAYVTETPQDTYKSNPTLGSLLLRSGGIYIRYAAKTIAQFLSSGITLLDTSSNKLAEFLSTGVNLFVNAVKRLSLTSTGLEMYDTDGATKVANISHYTSSNESRISILANKRSNNTTMSNYLFLQAGDKYTYNARIVISETDWDDYAYSTTAIEGYADELTLYDITRTSATKVFSAYSGSVCTNGSIKDMSSNILLTKYGYPGYISAPSWTTPTVYSSRCTVNSGGYMREGYKVTVSVEFTLSSSVSRSAGSSMYTILSNFPKPQRYTALSAVVKKSGTSDYYEIGASIELSTSTGNLRIASQGLALGSGDVVYVTGSYFANSAS